MSIWCKIQDRLTYVRIIALGYLVVIITGTLFLLLPAATVQGKQTDFLTALLTATTSTCVTGLVVVDTGTHWTVFGQTVILLMVQVGELGFNTIDIAGMTNASKLLTIVLMFIGGSPGSTAGGVKTVTTLVLIAYVWSNLRASKGVNLFKRRLDDDVIRKASNVVVISMILSVVAAVFICFFQPKLSALDVLFEVFAAISTAGMSTGLTRDLTVNSRIVILLLMYCGRIGSMSFALSFTERKKVAPIQLPVEKIMIG